MSQSNDFKAALSSSGFTGDLIIPGDAEYPSSLARFAKNSQRNAGLVAFPKTAEDVSKVIEFVTFYSSTHGKGGAIPVVVRGGGHSTSGASSTEGGIVIDLSKYMNTVRVDEEKQLGYVGGGANWGHVDKEAIKYGLATTGGTVNHTGVGGLSLGGGYGWLMGEHGMVIDNIVQVTIVIADGSILTANSTSHADLYWAIRGGGPNFGCVTEFVYQLHPQPSYVFGGPLIFPPPLLPAVMNALQEWRANAGEKEGAAMVMTNKGPTGVPILGVMVFYNGDEEEGRKKFANLIALGPVMNVTGMIPYEAMNSLSNDIIPYGANYFLNGTIRGENPVDSKVAQGVFNRMMEIASGEGGCASSSSPMISLFWEFVGLKKAASVPADATAFRMRLEHQAMPMMISWEGESAEATNDAKQRLKRMKEFVEEGLKGTFPNGKEENDTGYGNYEAEDPQSMDAAAPLYGGNYPRLQQVKRRYDPGMLFRSWYPIQPAEAPYGSGIRGVWARVRCFFEEFIRHFRAWPAKPPPKPYA